MIKNLASAYLGNLPQFQHRSFLRREDESGIPKPQVKGVPLSVAQQERLEADRDTMVPMGTAEEYLQHGDRQVQQAQNELERQTQLVIENAADAMDREALASQFREDMESGDSVMNAGGLEDYYNMTQSEKEDFVAMRTAQMGHSLGEFTKESLQAGLRAGAGVYNIPERARNTFGRTGQPGLGYKEYTLPIVDMFSDILTLKPFDSTPLPSPYPDQTVTKGEGLFDVTQAPWYKALDPTRMDDDTFALATTLGRGASVMAQFYYGSGFLGDKASKMVSGVNRFSKIVRSGLFHGTEMGVDALKALSMNMSDIDAQAVGVMRGGIAAGGAALRVPHALRGAGWDWFNKGSQTIPEKMFHALMRPNLRAKQAGADMWISKYGPKGTGQLKPNEVKMIEEFRDSLSHKLFDDPRLWNFTPGELIAYSRSAKTQIGEELQKALQKSWEAYSKGGKIFPFSDAVSDAAKLDPGNVEAAERLLRWLPRIRNNFRGGHIAGESVGTRFGQQSDKLAKRFFVTDESGEFVTKYVARNPMTQQYEPITQVQLRIPIKDAAGKTAKDAAGNTQYGLGDLLDDPMDFQFRQYARKGNGEFVNADYNGALVRLGTTGDRWVPLSAVRRFQVGHDAGVPILKPDALKTFTSRDAHQTMKLYNKQLKYNDPGVTDTMPNNMKDGLKESRANLRKGIEATDPPFTEQPGRVSRGELSPEEMKTLSTPLESNYGVSQRFREMQDMELLDDELINLYNNAEESIRGVIVSGATTAGAGMSWGARTAARTTMDKQALAKLLKGISQRNFSGGPKFLQKPGIKVRFQQARDYVGLPRLLKRFRDAQGQVHEYIPNRGWTAVQAPFRGFGGPRRSSLNPPEEFAIHPAQLPVHPDTVTKVMQTGEVINEQQERQSVPDSEATEATDSGGHFNAQGLWVVGR